MAGDYVVVYRPMRAALASAADRGPAFVRLHAWSERVNAAGFLLSIAAAATLCAARSERRPPS